MAFSYGTPSVGQISIHALRKESDIAFARTIRRRPISIHALRKESDFFLPSSSKTADISIHALRKESDTIRKLRIVNVIFQSTLSVRRATRRNRLSGRTIGISIHALRKESDFRRFWQ